MKCARRQPLRACAAAAAALAAGAAVQAQPVPAAEPAPQRLPEVTIVGTTPLPGLGTPLRDVPANVQTFGSKELGRQRQGNVAEFLEANPTSVTVNAAQGNPYQLDIAFRGFTASPLLGAAQGLSVFQDGVRINEPFGDVVNWDLLPQSAIGSLQVLPGSNPLFGLNTLGGALSITTKSGRRNPGSAVELSGGSFGRRSMQYEQGGASGAWDWFSTAHVARDRGWAEHNPSRINQFFAKLGFARDAAAFDVSVTAADNRLDGTQTLPASWFATTPRQAYTFPDRNRNRLAMLSAQGTYDLGPQLTVGGNVYLRHYGNQNTSSNVNDDFGQLDPVTGLVDSAQATNDRAAIDQTSYGIGVQVTATRPLGRRKNTLVIGAGADFGRAGFVQDAQPATFTAARAALASGDFVRETDAATRNRTLALFAQDVLALTPEWTLSLSARSDTARVSIRDRSGTAPALDGDHGFSRLNPAVGVTFNPSAAATFYGSYNEGVRTPTAIELTCADPLAPCKLPNSFLSDPSLKKVVARTVELGARGSADAAGWSAAWYRTELQDDIEFVSSGGANNAGYFQNVGRTRREGIELTGSARWRGVAVVARYGYIVAAYASRFVEHSPNNSSADAAGDIVVPAGARIPGIPRQSLKVRADGELGAGWRAGATLAVAGRSRARGDENNLDVHGEIPAYAVLNLDAEVDVGKGVKLFARIDNVFDRRYANFGILGRNAFANPARVFDPGAGQSETFLGLGAPRGGWLGLRYQWN